ncbi:MAG: beta-galactosidase, partial [Candidatus Korarchaeota archaeon]
MKYIYSFHRTFFDEKGNPLFILAGDYHYFRIPHSHWKRDFNEMQRMGLNSVFVYVPPCVHNPDEDEYVFSGYFGASLNGKQIFSRDVSEVLELAKDNNLYVFLRPGPIVVCELPENGLPLWLKRKYGHEIWSRLTLGKGSYGTYPTLTHPRYLRWARNWYGAIKKHLGKYVGDPIVAWQLDNETKSMEPILYLDKNPFLIKKYRAWLERRYKTIEHLNVLYGTSYKDFSEVLPPVEYSSNMRRNLWLSDWIRFHAIETVEYLNTLKKYVMELFPGNKLLFFVNDMPHTGVASLMPMDIVGKSSVGVYGIDLYPKVSPFNSKILDYPFLGGTIVDLVSACIPDNPPFGAEVGMGWWMHPPVVHHK